MNKMLRRFCILLTIISLGACSSEDDSSGMEPTEFSNEANIANDILQLVNQHRQDIGLSVLSKNETAEELAIDHTKYMISVSNINHDSFNERGAELTTQENATAAAENVDRFHPDAQSVVNGWLNSSGHRGNIEGNYLYTGISAIKDADGKYYYTQLFYR